MSNAVVLNKKISLRFSKSTNLRLAEEQTYRLYLKNVNIVSTITTGFFTQRHKALLTDKLTDKLMKWR